MKSRIMNYLRTHCILACPGIIQDEIDPEKTIGAGHIFSDGTYFWNDAFCNYVDRYNIPVPEEFRVPILENFETRMKRHALLGVEDRVESQNNPYLGYRYDVRIDKSGVVRYQNNTDCTDGAVLYMKPEDARYIINPMMAELFCYDTEGSGITEDELL